MKLNHTRYEEFRTLVFEGKLTPLKLLDFLEFEEVILESRVTNILREWDRGLDLYEGTEEQVIGLSLQIDDLKEEISYLRRAKDNLEKEIYEIRTSA